jgi:hypothetical protein
VHLQASQHIDLAGDPLNQQRSFLDTALEFVSVALILAGAAPAIIAALILAPLLIRAVAGWEGIAFCALLAGAVVVRAARQRRGAAAAAAAAAKSAG